MKSDTEKLKNSNLTIALAGNPNVGKSTVFNALTGMRQHTGNWAGKTVANASGTFTHRNIDFTLVDIPGTYSLMASSPDEEAAREFICFGQPDCIIVVLDATCLERNLNLAIQILEVNKKAVICVNLLDEATKKGIQIDLDELSLYLGVPVVGTAARSGEGLDELKDAVFDVAAGERKVFGTKIKYNSNLEKAITKLQNIIEDSKLFDDKTFSYLSKRFLALRLIDCDKKLDNSIKEYFNFSLAEHKTINKAFTEIHNELENIGMKQDDIRDIIVEGIVAKAQEIYAHCTCLCNKCYSRRDRKLDKILTSKLTGIPIMLLLFGVIFYITISGANYPSELLSMAFSKVQEWLYGLFDLLHSPPFLKGLLIDGMFKTLSWVVAVMLPPMAIFFPLFTLLEDFGYLPRVAFNMDRFFAKSGTSGKQSLTMLMGFGCNACGVTGCRIIESPRERIIATVTNNFVPCNGRFPTLIAIITMFFATGISLPFRSLVSAGLLLTVIVFGVVVTLLVSKLLSATLLKGLPSSFTLELPPYRRPQICKTIVRSLLDRTIFVLLRAMCVAAPAGIVIWLMSNIMINGESLCVIISNFLQPLGSLMGLDGVILLAFILGFPANEIVVPIIIMIYTASGTLVEYDSLSSLYNLFVENGWTWVTALCTMIFSLMHFPCSTTCLTIYKETKSLKWTLLSFILPTILGILLCMSINAIFFWV
ncbi:ferrous iron transport protein B [Clostridium sp. AM09-51]|uniref:ferrous iron transport protein B n=1 Tax=Pseudoruminococcus massiliensis TaxID=2086583 RepID=UPI000E48CE89|nr:ferrous iron transport protein B [Pseudoruminococcus massiliensis]RHO49126.1 ferrous iron transport protein B [Clostridium sp. AM09-51]